MGPPHPYSPQQALVSSILKHFQNSLTCLPPLCQVPHSWVGHHMCSLKHVSLPHSYRFQCTVHRAARGIVREPKNLITSDPLMKRAHQEKKVLNPTKLFKIWTMHMAPGSSLKATWPLALCPLSVLLKIPRASHIFSLLLGCGNEQSNLKRIGFFLPFDTTVTRKRPETWRPSRRCQNQGTAVWAPPSRSQMEVTGTAFKAGHEERRKRN